MNSIRFGLLTVSDSCFEYKKEDKSGPEVETEIEKILRGQICHKSIVPDDAYAIKEKLIFWSDSGHVDVIFTIGGTGFSKRDVTPEATKEIIQKEAPGIVIAMLMSSLQITPMAMLSRAICGIRGRTIIINLPGSPKAAKECLSIIAPAIPHAIDLLKDNKESIRDAHGYIQNESTEKISVQECRNKTSLCLGSITKRNRESPYPMISVEEALQMILKYVEPLSNKSNEDLEKVHGKILNGNLYSKYDLPPFRASIKDGYAVLANDGKGRRQVLNGIKAGGVATGIILQPGTCVRVNTGAPIPDDATAVVQVEDTKLIKGTDDNTEEKEIEIMSEVKHGQDIRPIGCDIKKGELILKAGTKLGAIELGLAAACGYKQVLVTDVPKIGVLSTGDELQCPGTALMPGHIYDSNKVTLLLMLRENGYDALDMGIAIDEENVMVNKIKHALKQVDVLITSGSVSMGDRDMLKPILQHYFDATIHFGRVNMKPGKPTTFATCMFQNRKKYLLCLPGNPVSATVTMYLFVLPLLKQLSKDYSTPTIVKAKLTSSYNLDPRPEYVRAILKWTDTDILPLAYSTGNQISSKLLSCRNANALLMLPARTTQKTVLQQGEVVQAMLLGFTQYT
ncbi:molybdenum cofactor synthesis protein cinnamon isoform X1 [Osmia lignaria lignaria]|uniref:molybdenum cofactor synthesis protein cinnamon isoform X1 n=1 Tax=Osmia lignaria lignaria TaxID=1437193 RepID=UPI001479769C|nr:gephyrin isoform X1 [Osmia lignaria]